MGAHGRYLTFDYAYEIIRLKIEMRMCKDKVDKTYNFFLNSKYRIFTNISMTSTKFACH